MLAEYTFRATENIHGRPDQVDEGDVAGCGRSSIDEGTLLVARLLRALHQGVHNLQHFYREELPLTSQIDPPLPDVLRPHPWITKITTKKYGDVMLTYTQRLDPKKALFKARMMMKEGEGGDANHAVELDVVVKFTPSYHRGAHQLLAAQKLAPELYHCRWEDDVEMVVVIMEFIKDGDCPRPAELAHDVRDLYTQSLRRAIKALHEKEWVFGDLRAPNVLFAGDQVRLIDFDWCGTSNKALYPSSINLNHPKDIGWDPEVRRRGLMKKKHDEHMFHKLTGETL
jgi:serine/threonine protein kinase